MRRLFGILSLLLFTGNMVRAQTSTGNKARSGSIYSEVGVGQPIDWSSSSADGMGLSGVSFVEPFVPGLANPAQWGNTVYGMATGSLSFKRNMAADNQSAATNTQVSANYFQVQFPIMRNKLGVSASISPFSQSNFRQIAIESKTIGTGASQDTLIYQTESRGDGGINMFELGAGWNITRNISVGYAASLVSASINNEISTIFLGNEYSDVTFNRRTSGTGFGNRLGVQLELPKMFNKNDLLSLGLSAFLPVKIDAKRVEKTNIISSSSGSTESVVTEDGEGLGRGTIRLPLSLSGGMTYQPGRLIGVSVEGIYQNWSDSRYAFDSADEQMLADRYKIGMGLRYFPYFKGSDKFLSHFKYRLGVSYDSGHLHIEGQNIETLMFSCGLGILSPNSNSSIDLSFEYGFRGTKGQNLVKEHIWGLRLSLNLAELMFFRPKLQ